MTSFISTAACNLLLDHMVGKTTLGSAVTPVYLALCTTTPTPAAFGTEVTGGTGYARKSMAGSAWDSAADRGILNATAQTWSATGGWGTVLGWGLFTAASGGTYLAGGTFARPHVIKNGDSFTVPVGGIELRDQPLSTPPTSGITDATIHKMLEHLVGKTTWAFASGSLRVGMTTTLPTDQVPGTEPTGGSYALQNIAAAEWDAAASRSSATNAAKTITSGADGVIRGIVLFDDASRTNYLAWYKLDPPVRLDAGQTLQVNSGSTITLNDPTA